MKKVINSVLALVFVLSLGSFAFAQDANMSTTNTNTTMSGGMMEHHRKHKHHHRGHKMHKMHKMHKKMDGGTMNSNT